MKKIKKVPFKGTLFMVVPPCGIEPQPSEPESEILSIKLRGQNHTNIVKFLRGLPVNISGSTQLLSHGLAQLNRGENLDSAAVFT